MFDAETFLLGREQFGMRFGLERMARLLARLGAPHDAIPAVHVVGTNGKSTTARLAAVALAAQRRDSERDDDPPLDVGCFTSPHLRRFRERVSVNGSELGEREFAAATARVAEAVEAMDRTSDDDDRVTQFEAVNAAALVAFRAAGCGAMVVEAGLGGRLDSTNTLGDSRVQVLTSVGLDHTEYLGETLGEIAGEKLAVVRDGATLVSGPLPPEVKHLPAKRATEAGARLVPVEREMAAFVAVPGHFMRQNASVALVVARAMWEALGRRRFDDDAAVAAILAALESGALDGRLAVHGKDPLVVFDVAHNAEAAAELAAAIRELAGDRPLTLVLGMLADKRVAATITELLPLAEGAICTQPANPRALAAGDLAAVVADLAPQLELNTATDPAAALAAAVAAAGRDGAVLATGSNYLIGDLVREPGAAATI